MKICIDAGHYGNYNRSTVNPAYWESQFSWKFHLMLKSELEKYGIEVIVTRTNQAVDMDLTERGRKSAGCDLFLSIHSNACSNSSADYPLACCCVNGTTDVLGNELAEIVGKCMGSSGKARIWKREGNGGSDYYGVLRGAASVGTPGILLEHGFHTNPKNTNWLLDDANLKKMAAEEALVIAEYFGINVTNTTDSSEKRIWDALKSAGLSDTGAAGLMGNLKAESNLQPNNLQNTFEKKLGFNDVAYTAAVDDGTYTNFVNDGAGYGLAQWTYPTRKAAMLAFAKARQRSIGDLDMQLEFLLQELRTDYPALFRRLCTSSDVRAASDAVLTQFERPRDMSETVKTRRAGFASEILREFGGESSVAVTIDMPNIAAGVLTIDGKKYTVTLKEI